jgi:hypothetical protein
MSFKIFSIFVNNLLKSSYMNRIILFVLFFISTSPLVKSQSQFGNVQFNMDQYRSNNTYGRGNLTVDEIDGTPYLIMNSRLERS